MNCKNVNQKLLFYLDNELTEKEKRTVELHLAMCHACRKELEALSTTHNLLNRSFQSLSAKTAPPWGWAELELRLTALSENRPTHIRRAISGIIALFLYGSRWKPILSIAVVIAIIVGAVLFVPRITGPSPEILASDIATDSPEIRALTDGTPTVEATKVSGTVGYVLSQGTSGESNLAYVDLQGGEVIHLFRLVIPSLTEEDKAQATDIAIADINIQKILNSGGIVAGVFLIPPHLRLDIIDGEPTVWSGSTLVGVTLSAPNQKWVARIDMGKGKVMDISKLFTPPSMIKQTGKSGVLFSKEDLINIAKSDTRVVTLLNEGAVVINTATGGKRMTNRGSVIFKLEEELWSVSIDLTSGTVTQVAPIPEARHSRSNVFTP